MCFSTFSSQKQSYPNMAPSTPMTSAGGDVLVSLLSQYVLEYGLDSYPPGHLWATRSASLLGSRFRLFAGSCSTGGDFSAMNALLSHPPSPRFEIAGDTLICDSRPYNRGHDLLAFMMEAQRSTPVWRRCKSQPNITPSGSGDSKHSQPTRVSQSDESGALSTARNAESASSP